MTTTTIVQPTYNQKTPKKRQAALANLRKAHAVTKATGARNGLDPLNLEKYTKDKKASRKHDLSIQQELLFRMGEHVTKVLRTTSTAQILKQSYGVKSLIDTWTNLTKLSYPMGLAARETNPMAQLMGGVLDEFKKSLNINVNVTTKDSATTIETTSCGPSAKLPSNTLLSDTEKVNKSIGYDVNVV